MKRQTAILCVCVALGLWLLWPLGAGDTRAAERGTDPPLIDWPSPNVTLIGVFHRASGAAGTGEIMIHVGDRQWAFEVMRFEQTGLEPRGRLTQTVILPSPLRLTGVPGLINPLSKKDLTGKRYQFVGNIYKLDGVMRLRAAQELTPVK